MLHALTTHWPEYLIEACLLGAFMLAACAAVVLIEHPGSPVRARLHSPVLRRSIIGLLMGLTAVTLIYSPASQRSGAHMNPAITLSFLALGKIAPWDAAFYILAQFVGGLTGVRIASTVAGPLVRHASVKHVATVPGPRGRTVAWAAEFAIAFVMMSMVLGMTNSDATTPYTGLVAGALVALYITIEAPLSGMSLNPARTLASAVPARSYSGLWIYFTAPPLAMLAAAGVYVALAGQHAVYCAKLHHNHDGPCIFRCRRDEMPRRAATPPALRGIRDIADAPSHAPATHIDHHGG